MESYQSKEEKEVKKDESKLDEIFKKISEEFVGLREKFKEEFNKKFIEPELRKSEERKKEIEEWKKFQEDQFKEMESAQKKFEEFMELAKDLEKVKLLEHRNPMISEESEKSRARGYTKESIEAWEKLHPEDKKS